MSPIEAQLYRIMHIRRMTGLAPKVLDLPPNAYDALVEDLGPHTRWQAQSTEFGVHIFCHGDEIRIIRGPTYCAGDLTK